MLLKAAAVFAVLLTPSYTNARTHQCTHSHILKPPAVSGHTSCELRGQGRASTTPHLTHHHPLYVTHSGPFQTLCHVSTAGGEGLLWN